MASLFFSPSQVVYREGIFVRSTPNIEAGRIVRIVPFGTVLKATGKVRLILAIRWTLDPAPKVGAGGSGGRTEV